MRYRYQDPKTTQTLAEGLAEYYAAHPEFAGDADFLGQPRETVLAHDVCHVVFGLGATSEEELIVEVWTFFGCYLPVEKIVRAPKVAFVRELFRIFGLRRLIRRFILTLPRVLRALVATRRMTRRWPHYGWQAYTETPLQELRREFGIQLV